jgi:FkbM family methyltransferase
MPSHDKDKIFTQFHKSETISTTSRIKRFVYNPFKYIFSIAVKNGLNRVYKKGIKVKTKVFFEEKIQIVLPSANDIYLTGCKSHDSELRLSKFIIKQLNKGDTFVDVGAHFGFYSLLAANLVGIEGKVFAFEPTKNSFNILKNNTFGRNNVEVFNMALSHNEDDLIFYEFPIFYSEYNSFNNQQYVNEYWYQSNQPKESVVKCITGDNYFIKNSITPKIIKIDVEGAELEVLKGCADFLENYSGYIILECMTHSKNNSPHMMAIDYLLSKGYSIFVIDKNGDHLKAENLSNYLDQLTIASDNLVCFKEK